VSTTETGFVNKETVFWKCTGNSTEYRLQLHSTKIITKTHHSLRFRLWSVSWN